jgi:hypothetical protein
VEFSPLGAPAGTPRASDAVRRRRRRVAFALLVIIAAVSLFAWRVRSPGTPAAKPAPTPEISQRPARMVPDSVRIKVEVVNATSTRRLATLATAWLRDQGFDVVSIGTASEKERRDSTLVLDRSGHPEWAAMAARAMGGARVEARPDSSRYLDVTVLVGRLWRPPPQALYP